MSALWILLLPLAAALVAPWVGRAARAFAAGVLLLDAAVLVTLWAQHDPTVAASMASFSASWVPQLGIRFSLAVDGLALLLSLMSCAVGAAALIGTPGRPDDGPFCGLFLATIAGVLGVFLATDLVLFFVCFEIMLLPAVALIIGWGSGDSRRSAMRFFVYTQLGGLLMLIAIIGLHQASFGLTGVRTFDIAALTALPLSDALASLFLLGFFLAFAVKLPLVPFHTWQPDAYASAPTEAAILLSALMAKTAGFGILRFVLPMFPAAAERFAPAAMVWGLVTIVYAAWLAYGQRDVVRVIAYSSASHLGYVVLGAFALNDLGRSGAIVQMFCHGLSVAGLLLVFGHVARQTGTRDLDRLGGLWQTAPALGGMSLVFTLATLGLPGLGNFIGEFLVLAGVFRMHPVVGAIAATGAVLSAAYALRVIQRVFFGPREPTVTTTELSPAALGVCVALAATLLWAGLHPQPMLDLVRTPAVMPELMLGVRP